MTSKPSLPALPHSWSELSWQQLCVCWQAKMRYGGNPDVARVAALLDLLGCTVCREKAPVIHTLTGETVYQLRDREGCQWTLTAREAAHLGSHTLPWFDYPYGDPGEKEERDKNGKITKERREPVTGYVSGFRDAMMLPEDTVELSSPSLLLFMPIARRRRFQLPQVACNNLTWQQYRALQGVAPQLFQEGVDDEQVLGLQAQFLAHCLVPRSLALLDTTGGSIRFRPHYEYRYNTEQAEGMVPYFERGLKREGKRWQGGHGKATFGTLFHIAFQCYQTALEYYSVSYPLLFSDSKKNDQLRDALTGEVGTINTIMKYAGYAEQQQVYDSNLPFVLDILNTMAKEAKEIEKMNSKIKKK